jgi:uncharacterized protein (DUF362 family)
MPRVVIERVKNDKYKESVFKALEQLEIWKLKDVNSVLIKPNLCHYYSADTGITTDVQIVGFIIDFIREKLNRDAKIIIGEADATEMKVDIAFKVLGYEKLSKVKKVSLLNLSRDKKIYVNGKFIKNIPATIKNVDLLISAPKLKTHVDVKMSCCLKNQFGAIPYRKKAVFHKNVAEVIVEAAKFMKPHVCLVDGVIALEGMGPLSEGRPIRMNLIIAGDDPVATDYVCSKIMGISKVGYLELAEKERVGSTKNLEILGESIEHVKRKFKVMSPISYIAFYARKFNLGSIAFILEHLS